MLNDHQSSKFTKLTKLTQLARTARLMSTKKIFEKSSFESAAPPPMPGSEAFLDAQEAPEDTEGAPGWADEDDWDWGRNRKKLLEFIDCSQTIDCKNVYVYKLLTNDWS